MPVRQRVRTRSLMLLGMLSIFLAACASSPRAAATATVTATPTFTPTATLVPTVTVPTIPPTHIPTPTTTSNATPAYTPFQSLLKEVVARGPVYVTGDQAPLTALTAAGNTLSVMLQHRPDVAAKLRATGTFTVVASHSEQICDLTYFAGNSATLCASYGYGGAGGTSIHPITACNERNLLKEPDDPYLRGVSAVGQNICVHELAHTVMDVGLSPQDLADIEVRFQTVQATSLWTGDYAMTNSMEFWAVMSQFYFSAGPNATYAAFHHIANGPAALKQYDPLTFALLDAIYRGSANLS